MERIDDLKLIKKHYSEKMMHMCRELFPTMLETPGLLYELLTMHFEPTKFLYEDIVNNDLKYDFKSYIESLIGLEKEQKVEVTKTPEELLDEAGYILYECKSEEDIQSFRHYYKRKDGKTITYEKGTIPADINGEELCTFRGGRLSSCYVFFAVKKNVDEIKRENFKKPKRQDEYGTSVLSIQFTRDKHKVSIKNRYNHTVGNPDATFSNNLNNIIPGLAEAFNKKYKFKSKPNEQFNFDMLGYVMADDGKYYKYNCEIDNIFYCPNNIIIVNYSVRKYDKSRYIAFDKYLLDIKDKCFLNAPDIFTQSIDKIKTVEQTVNNGLRKIIINDQIIIETNDKGQIISYCNPIIERIGIGFLEHNTTIEHIDLPNVKYINSSFLKLNRNLLEISLPNVEYIAHDFLEYNERLERISLPKVKEIGRNFLDSNKGLTRIDFPNLVSAGNYFIYQNRDIDYVNLPKLESIPAFFLYKNKKLKSLSLPCAVSCSLRVLSENNILEHIELPNAIHISDGFLMNNTALISIDLPKVQVIGDNFMMINEVLEDINIPNVEEIGSYFLHRNIGLKSIYTPKLEMKSVFVLDNNPNISPDKIKGLKKQLFIV